MGARCPSCARFHLARDARRRAAKPQRAIWDSSRWKRTRERVFRRDGYTCVECGRNRDELGENERLLADHVRGVVACMADGTAFDVDECETRCSTCSGRRDGRRY